MNSKQNVNEISLNKLIGILKIVELDFECLSCNKIKPNFLEDLTGRITKKIKDKAKTGSPGGTISKSLFLKFPRIYEVW